MYPYIWHITQALAVKSYGVAIGVAFFVGIFLAVRKARKLGFDANDFIDLGFWILGSAIVGARLFYVLFHVRAYIAEPLAMLKIWRGGLVFYGGLAAAVAASLAYMKVRKIPVWLGCDIVAPFVALGYAITRVGCFLNGCCFGKVTTLPWGVTFPAGSAAGDYGATYMFRRLLLGQPITDVHLHPTQLYAVGINLLIFVLLLLWWRRRRFDGQIFWGYLALYAVYRFGIEFLRGDNARLLGPFTVAQVMSVALFACALAAYFNLRARGVLTTTAPPAARPKKK